MAQNSRIIISLRVNGQNAPSKRYREADVLENKIQPAADFKKHVWTLRANRDSESKGGRQYFKKTKMPGWPYWYQTTSTPDLKGCKRVIS